MKRLEPDQTAACRLSNWNNKLDDIQKEAIQTPTGVGRVIFRIQKIEIYRRGAILGSDLIYTIMVWTCYL